jgi:hypothetical protein
MWCIRNVFDGGWCVSCIVPKNTATKASLARLNVLGLQFLVIWPHGLLAQTCRRVLSRIIRRSRRRRATSFVNCGWFLAPILLLFSFGPCFVNCLVARIDIWCNFGLNSRRSWARQRWVITCDRWCFREWLVVCLRVSAYRIGWPLDPLYTPWSRVKVLSPFYGGGKILMNMEWSNVGRLQIISHGILIVIFILILMWVALQDDQ